MSIDSSSLGIPQGKLEEWFSKEKFKESIPKPSTALPGFKNPEVPILRQYKVDPGQNFWSQFPHFDLPKPGDYNSPIDYEALERNYITVKGKMSYDEIDMMERTLFNLKHGADSFVDESLLPGMSSDNSPTMENSQVGSQYTDVLCTMIKNKLVAGPFTHPPFKDFRSNPLFTVQQETKFRPILNLSHPPKASYNDAICTDQIRKIEMCTITQVATLIKKFGSEAILSKIDQRNAYKNIPSKRSQWRLVGFYWLGKYFVELRLVFGSGSAPANYDDFSGAFTAMVAADSLTNPEFLLRQLDDQICITPSLEQNKAFVESYLHHAKEINLSLAGFDEPDKSFAFKSSGKILGVIFDAKTSSWKFDDSKISRFQLILLQAKNKPRCSINLLQRVIGVMNTVLQLCPVLKGFRTPIINDLRRAYSKSPVILSQGSVYCLHSWLKMFSDLKNYFPIPDFSISIPKDVLCVISDAAGLSQTENYDHKIGVGAAAYVSSTTNIFTACSEYWDPKFIKHTYDANNKFIGNKTTTLEVMGTILILFKCAHLLKNSMVRIQCDNIAVVYGLLNGRSKEDVWASMFISAIIYVTSCLECKIIPEHCPRLSSTPAVIADLLSRDDSKGREMVKRLRVPVTSGWPKSIVSWMKNPTYNEVFKQELLEDFRDALLNPGKLVFGHHLFFLTYWVYKPQLLHGPSFW